MPHALPPLGHPARELFDVQTLVDVATGKEPVHCRRHTLRRAAEKSFTAMPAVKRMAYFYVNPSNDDLQLITIGRRGGFKVEWTFGPITRGTRLL